MKNRGNFPGIPVVDFLMALVVVFLALFILSYALINEEAKTANAAKDIPNDELIRISVFWGPSNDDVDTYVADPADHLVYFRRLQDGLMNLRRDDTGSNSNTVMTPDGQTVTTPQDEEQVDIRGIIPGEYIVNVHMFRKGTLEPTKVTVTLYNLKSSNTKVTERVLELSRDGEEKTAFRFTLTPNGEAVDINELPKKFVGNSVAQ